MTLNLTRYIRIYDRAHERGAAGPRGAQACDQHQGDRRVAHPRQRFALPLGLTKEDTMKKLTMEFDRIEDTLELDIAYSVGLHGFYYEVEAARVNGDNVARDRVELTVAEETKLKNRCIEAAAEM